MAGVVRTPADRIPSTTGMAYKLFALRDGQLYPPMVPNPGCSSTPTGVWIDASPGLPASPTRTGRPHVCAGGPGTHRSRRTTVALRPGWHLSEVPYAPQFAVLDRTTGERFFPPELVWAECLYSADSDYQDQADAFGVTATGQFRHAYAGLPYVPAGGCYRYRTNPNPATPVWVIAGSMFVLRLLSVDESDEICLQAGILPIRQLSMSSAKI